MYDIGMERDMYDIGIEDIDDWDYVEIAPRSEYDIYGDRLIPVPALEEFDIDDVLIQEEEEKLIG